MGKDLVKEKEKKDMLSKEDEKIRKMNLDKIERSKSKKKPHYSWEHLGINMILNEHIRTDDN